MSGNIVKTLLTNTNEASQGASRRLKWAPKEPLRTLRGPPSNPKTSLGQPKGHPRLPNDPPSDVTIDNMWSMSTVETTKVQHNPNILKYRNNQRYLITLSVPIARSGLIASRPPREPLFSVFTVFFSVIRSGGWCGGSHLHGV